MAEQTNVEAAVARAVAECGGSSVQKIAEACLNIATSAPGDEAVLLRLEVIQTSLTAAVGSHVAGACMSRLRELAAEFERGALAVLPLAAASRAARQPTPPRD